MLVLHASLELFLQELFDVLVEVLYELLLLSFAFLLQFQTYFFMLFLEPAHFFLPVVDLGLEVDLDLVLESVDLFLQNVDLTLLCPYFFLQLEDNHLMAALCYLSLRQRILQLYFLLDDALDLNFVFFCYFPDFFLMNFGEVLLLFFLADQQFLLVVLILLLYGYYLPFQPYFVLLGAGLLL